MLINLQDIQVSCFHNSILEIFKEIILVNLEHIMEIMEELGIVHITQDMQVSCFHNSILEIFKEIIQPSIQDTLRVIQFKPHNQAQLIIFGDE